MNPSPEEALFASALEKCGASAGRFLHLEATRTFCCPLSHSDRTRRPLLLERRLGQAAGKIASAMNQAFSEQRRRVKPIENQMAMEGRLDAKGANSGQLGPGLESRATQPRRLAQRRQGGLRSGNKPSSNCRPGVVTIPINPAFQVGPEIIGPFQPQRHGRIGWRRARLCNRSKSLAVTRWWGPATAGRSNSASSRESCSAGSSLAWKSRKASRTTSLASAYPPPRTFLATNCCSFFGSVISMPEKSKSALGLSNLIYLP